MSKKGLWLAGMLFSTVLAYPSDHYRMAGGSGDFYFGHISYIEAKSDGNDPMIWRAVTDFSEPATLNAPIGPGDIIRTTDARRCEVQFDSGTIIRLDVNTELKVETILAGSLSKDTAMSNFVLSSGRIYIMYKEYDDRETFQVLTSNAAVKPKHASVAVIAVPGDVSTEIRVRSGKASVLFGAEAERSRTRDVRKLERLIVRADSSFEESAAPPDAEFEKWNEALNASFVELHKGVSPLPKPLRHLPLAVHNFAQKFGNENGEWLWDDLYGYVWRPYLNDMRYPWGGWDPFIYGHWTESGGSMFWVPAESWGWVPYHLGLWQWDRKLGWVWLPGSLFAPAFASWDYFWGYFSWRPWSLFDWFLQGGSVRLYYAYGFETDWDWKARLRGYPHRASDDTTGALTQVRKDQLKEKASSSVSVPPEMKKAYKNIVAALGRKDGRVVESMRGMLERTIFVAQSEINSRRLQEKVLTWDAVREAAPKSDAGSVAEPPSRSPSLDALLTYRRNAAAEPRPGAAVPAEAAPRPLVGPSPARADRFRDWNPDIRIARRLGVRIDYSSRTNEVICPELKTSSRDIGRRGLRMSSGGLVRDFSRGSSEGYDPSGTTSSNGASSVHKQAQGSSHQGTKGEDGKTKKD